MILGWLFFLKLAIQISYFKEWMLGFAILPKAGNMLKLQEWILDFAVLHKEGDIERHLTVPRGMDTWLCCSS